jgi:acetyltransferase-like isoleucine patch superfamily enzyme
MGAFTMHPILYNPIFGYVKIDRLIRPNLHIGNDVWIGENTIILPNVMHIGDGAVIGAGSVVTRDVEEYSIVAGNPAKEIRKRFSKTIVEQIKTTRWWDLDKDVLIQKIPELESIVKDDIKGKV